MRNTPIEINPIAGALGAEISGVNIVGDLSDATVKALRQALLPAITVERELAHKELVRVQVPELTFERKLRLIHRREGTLSHAAEALLTVVEAQSALRRGRFSFSAER